MCYRDLHQGTSQCSVSKGDGISSSTGGTDYPVPAVHAAWAKLFHFNILS